MHNLVANFTKILSIVKKNLIDVLDEYGNLTRPGNKPKFSDAEVITLSLLSEALMFDSEHYLFKVLNKNFKSAFPNLIDRSGYNRRRKNLNSLTERVWRSLVKKLSFGEDTFVIDSMPIHICRFSRAKRTRVCQHRYETAPDYGYCAAQNQTYFGYKLHGLASLNGIIADFELTKASVADIHYLQEIKYQYAGCTILGDRAYLSNPLQTELFEEHRILLNTPMRNNQKNYRKQPAIFRKSRKRIETVFSQFCDQFKIQTNYAKLFDGFATRLMAKIAAFTLLQFLNIFEFGRELNHVKHTLI
jgi:hypothetical protein